MTDTRSTDSDIAIIGLAGLFAGCRDAEAFWTNITRKVDNVTDAPESWAHPWYDPALAGSSLDSGRIGTRKVGLIGDLATFSPLDFGIPPTAIEGDPAHFLALRLASDALRDSGYEERTFDRQKAGIIVGHGHNPNRGDMLGLQFGLAIEQTVEVVGQLYPDLGLEVLEEIREGLKKSQPRIQIEQAPSLVSNVISGRIANRLDLMGPNYMIDAACASTLVAVDLASRDLLSGRSDMMIAGGVQASMPAQIYMLFEVIGALSHSEIRPFSSAANGTLLSEGVGFVVLKRLRDALRDDDRIYAVLKGVGVSSDGKAMGLMAPRLEGESLAIERAYRQAGVDPKAVSLVEAHGTGIPLGDRTEIQALTSVFGGRQGGYPTCALGSVKSMIGHCIPAAGAASLIKTALALHYKVLPPTICDEVNPELEMETTPFYVNTEVRPWIHGGPEPRRAGIDAFGFGGVNTHAVLEEFRQSDVPTSHTIGRWLIDSAGESAEGEPMAADQAGETPEARAELTTWASWPSELVVLTATSRSDLIGRAKETVEQLRNSPGSVLATIASKAAMEAPRDVRLAVVAESVEDLEQKLERAIRQLEKSDRRRFASRKGVFFSQEARPEGKVAFMFSSEGSQYPNMLSDLSLYFPKVGRWFDFLDETFPRSPKPSDCVFPAPTCLDDAAKERAERRLFAGDLASESVSTASQALYEVLRDLGARCDVLVGHSAGEHAALRASRRARTRSLDKLQEEMRLLNDVYEQLEKGESVPTGRVLSVGGLDEANLERLLDEHPETLFLVADNCPGQFILFVVAEAGDAVVGRLRAEGALCIDLPFNRGYHTRLFQRGVEAFRAYYERGIDPGLGGVEIYSCGIAAPLPDETHAALDVAAEQWGQPVLFRQTIENLFEDGVRVFVEIGASNSLTAFVDATLRGREYLALPSNVQGQPALGRFLQLLGRLFVEKLDVDIQRLFVNRSVPVQELMDGSWATGREGEMVLPSELTRLSLDDEFLQEFRKRDLSQSTGSRPEAPRQVSAEARAAAEAILASHMDLMTRLLESESQVTSLLGRRLEKPD